MYYTFLVLASVNQSSTNGSLTPGELKEMSLKAEDLEQVAILYDQIRALRRKAEKNIDKKLADAFDQHLK